MTHDDRREFLQFLADHDVPAFIRRAQGVQDAWKRALQDCEKQRNELLEMPILRLGILAETIGRNWEAYAEELVDSAVAQTLKQHHDDWRPTLRVAVNATTDRRKWSRATEELVTAFQRFNKKWTTFVAEYDFAHVNDIRDGYNRWYVIEKSCAFDSDRIGAEGFVEIEHATADDVLIELPLLDIPQLR
ncbi:MAG: hypothetical protein KDB27_08680 [Planctomycetales bacterium]|nr:hypothetical protein [Planctomycetales bacterium]